MSRTELLPPKMRGKVLVAATGCWLWQGAHGPNGYGVVWIGTRRGDNRRAQAHRMAYESLVGPIPDGLVLDHLCRVRDCVNPAHLEAVTQAENTRRGIGPAMLGLLNSRKTECANGHAFDEANTVRRRTGGRRCRECDRERRARRTPDQIQRDRAADRERARLNRLRRRREARLLAD